MSNKKYLLREFSTFEYDQKEVEQAESDKPLVLKGVLQRCNTLNQNGRVYPEDVLIREVNNYQKLIDENRAFGELDHADSPIVNLKNVSHLIKEIWLDKDGVVYGKVQILDTPAGNIIKGIIKAGAKPGISSRALGSLMEDNRGVKVVQDDLQIICWDFVSEPSTPGAFMMTEAKQIDLDKIPETMTRSDKVYRVLNDVINVGKKK
jgi:hypothetical protein